MSKKDRLAEELDKYLSSRYREEAYEFNIKIMKVHVPEKVRKSLTESEVNDIFMHESAVQLEDFIDELRSDYSWISEWSQEGRSGGWLVIQPDDPVLGFNGECLSG